MVSIVMRGTAGGRNPAVVPAFCACAESNEAESAVPTAIAPMSLRDGIRLFIHEPLLVNRFVFALLRRATNCSRRDLGDDIVDITHIL